MPREEPRKDGDWEPIDLSISELTFGLEGGTQSVTSLNYPNWWISSICIPNNGEELWYTTSYPEIYTLSVEGLSAVAKTNTVEVTVDVSSTPRNWSLEMTAGDIFAKIKISQHQ